MSYLHMIYRLMNSNDQLVVYIIRLCRCQNAQRARAFVNLSHLGIRLYIIFQS